MNDTCQCSLTMASRPASKVRIMICEKCGAVYAAGKKPMLLNRFLRMFPGMSLSICLDLQPRYKVRAKRYMDRVLNTAY